MKRYVNEEEVSEMTGIAIQTLRNWRHVRRGFPYIKLGRAIRYDPDEITEFIESKKIRPEASL